MIKFQKNFKTPLVLLMILQISNPTLSSDQTSIDLPPLEHALEEIGAVFGIINTINEIKDKYTIIFEEKFKDLEAYPEMSLSDLGDEIILILDNTKELPDDIRENFKKLVTVKKMSNSIGEIQAPHPLISEILIQLTNFKLAKIKEGLPVLLKHFNMQDIAKINQEITTYRNSVDKMRTRKIYKSIDDIDTDLKKLFDKINPILKNSPLYTAATTRYNSQATESLSAVELTANKIRLLKIFNYRIAKNKRK